MSLQSRFHRSQFFTYQIRDGEEQARMKEKIKKITKTIPDFIIDKSTSSALGLALQLLDKGFEDFEQISGKYILKYLGKELILQQQNMDEVNLVPLSVSDGFKNVQELEKRDAHKLFFQSPILHQPFPSIKKQQNNEPEQFLSKSFSTKDKISNFKINLEQCMVQVEDTSHSHQIIDYPIEGIRCWEYEIQNQKRYDEDSLENCDVFQKYIRAENFQLIQPLIEEIQQPKQQPNQQNGIQDISVNPQNKAKNTQEKDQGSEIQFFYNQYIGQRGVHPKILFAISNLTGGQYDLLYSRKSNTFVDILNGQIEISKSYLNSKDQEDIEKFKNSKIHSIIRDRKTSRTIQVVSK